MRDTSQNKIVQFANCAKRGHARNMFAKKQHAQGHLPHVMSCQRPVATPMVLQQMHCKIIGKTQPTLGTTPKQRKPTNQCRKIQTPPPPPGCSKLKAGSLRYSKGAAIGGHPKRMGNAKTDMKAIWRNHAPTKAKIRPNQIRTKDCEKKTTQRATSRDRVS